MFGAQGFVPPYFPSCFGFKLRLCPTCVRVGSAAEQDGRLRVGDRLVVVNGVELLNVKHDEAVHSLRINGSHVKMVVSRLPVLQKQVLEIAFAKGVGGLGFSISGGTDDMEGDDASIYVTDILPQVKW